MPCAKTSHTAPMIVSVLPLGEDENGEARDRPIPEPSAIITAVVAMAVSVPAMIALQDAPFHAVISHSLAVSTTVTLSPANVVSAIEIAPLEKCWAAISR